MSEENDLDACLIMHQAGEHDLANDAFTREPSFDKFLTDHLRFWKESGIRAPLNEIQSIHAWMNQLKDKGAEETLRRMAARLVLLNRAAIELHELGHDAEKEAGIYDNQ